MKIYLFLNLKYLTWHLYDIMLVQYCARPKQEGWLIFTPRCDVRNTYYITQTHIRSIYKEKKIEHLD